MGCLGDGVFRDWLIMHGVWVAVFRDVVFEGAVF